MKSFGDVRSHVKGTGFFKNFYHWNQVFHWNMLNDSGAIGIFEQGREGGKLVSFPCMTKG